MHSPTSLRIAATSLALALASFACTEAHRPDDVDTKPPEPQPTVLAVVSPALPAEPLPPKLEEAPGESPRLGDVKGVAELANRIEGWFEDHGSRRIHLQVDKPLYQPAETIWVKVWDLRTASVSGDPETKGVKLELVDPKGAVVQEKRLREEGGTASNDFVLAPDAAGGEYLVRAIADGDVKGERAIIVSRYEAPRLKKTLEFVRKAYGEGDDVSATVTVKRPTGEPLKNQQITAAIRLDGVDLPRVKLSTDGDGNALVRFALPAKIEVGDALLTVLIPDGGVTESISKAVPIILKRLQFSFFPEGGQLVSGLESRVYFEAKNPLGKPADIEGRLVDDHGHTTATFRSHHDGLGRFTFTPATGRAYHAEITRPVGISERITLPVPEEDGCVLRAFDDLDGEGQAIRVRVDCTETRRVIVSATLRENPFEAVAVEVAPNAPAIVHLRAKDPKVTRQQGVARVTLFDDAFAPLAERLVFRHRTGTLKVTVKPDRASYAPREEVVLDVTTADASGTPLSAELALSVVDDTVVSFADDKKGHLLSRLFLEPELPGKIEEPNFYFDATRPESALAMDLLLGTRGYRRFEWVPVLAVDPDPKVRAEQRRAEQERLEQEARRREVASIAVEKKGGWWRGNFPEAAMEMDDAPMRGIPLAPPRPVAPPPPLGKLELGPLKELRDFRKNDLADGLFRRGNLEGKIGRQQMPALDGFMPVRVFPVPAYTSEFTGVRSDFRETIFWAPTVRTDAGGRATVRFPTSDAVTSFRVFAEGIGGGLAGRDETVFKSSLPFSLSVKLPVEVSAGDRILAPLSLSNERSRGLDVEVDADFGSLVKRTGEVVTKVSVGASARQAMFIPLEVTHQSGSSPVRVRATAGGLVDEFARTLTVTPLGFPQQFARSGDARGTVSHTVDLGAAIDGSATARVTLYPSPVATLTKGLEGMLRQPSGCFEQTSSTNYPNVMILQYLRQHDVADGALLEKSTKLIEDGYKRLTSFESPKKGYEWFGGDPGHEALTAYGLVEFADMQRAWGSVDEGMITRTATWLKTRRDGKGGYQRDPKALDSFGRATPQVTDAYITWALASVGTKGIETELAALQKTALDTKDAYVLALAANALLVTPSLREAGLAAAARLASMQEKDGAWRQADHSITRSGGANLHVETTSLAVLALLESKAHGERVRTAVAWLQNNRGGFGEWGATQATVLALKAMTAYADQSRQTRSPGRVTLVINGTRASESSWEAGRRDPVVVEAAGQLFRAGANTIEIRSESGESLPYSLVVEYRSAQPATSPDASVDLATSLERTQLKLGETVRLNATITNKRHAGQPMTIARVGLPGGLSFQTWQLQALRDKGLVAFYETRAREVILYFRELKPDEVKRIPLDLVATVPGSYTAPASSAYLYYTDEHKTWTAPVSVTIEP